ncbi:hypothetical protein [Aquitalea magnusonii]|uniref:Fap amyloid fibril minor component n=1 Tax=Aquitalea magnusonii TaxID=332411 RepID=A0A318JMS1_9NEIS|nr:hypothetical protein [Aquitalea magnusonii]PXX51250.1 hypothetical protein DFR38_101312 [Aquitalea magnusonii]
MRILQMLWLGGGLSAVLAHADQLALIENSGQSAQGVLAVNQAAGNANQQGNLQALAVAGGLAVASVGLSQQQGRVQDDTAQQNLRASIGGAAFAGSQGVLAVNQSAGYANQSLNAFSLAQAAKAQASVRDMPAAVQDAVLAGATAATPAGAPASGSAGQTTELSAAAFQGSRGLVQLNQIAGSHNLAVNVVAVQWANP